MKLKFDTLQNMPKLASLAWQKYKVGTEIQILAACKLKSQKFWAISCDHWHSSKARP